MSVRGRLGSPPSPGAAARAIAGHAAAAAVLALGNLIAILVTVGWPHGGLPVRLAHHAYDAGQTLGLSGLVALPVVVWLLRVRAPLWVALVVYAGAATVVMHVVLGFDLTRQSLVVLDGKLATPLFVVFVVLCGLAIPVAHLLGAWLSRYRRLRYLPLVLAAGGIITNQAVVRDDYPGLHGTVSWCALTLIAATLGPRLEAPARALWSRRDARIAAALAAVASLVALALPPSNRVRVELFRQPGAIAPWLLAKLVWSSPPLLRPAPPPASSWFADRAALPPVPPSRPGLGGRNPVVVLITVDALRADVVADPGNDKLFPTLTQLKRGGAHFTRATSAGSQTAVSLTSAFSGRYFSQLRWAMFGRGSRRFAYAAEDPSPRFPELLRDRGVTTVTFSSLNFLGSEYGVARGFSEHRVIPDGRQHAMGRQMVDPIVERLGRVRDEPFFLYVHLMEPHAPYDRGAMKGGSDFERYLSEVAAVDAEIARVVKAMRRFGGRGFVLLAADHGEAFGEHDTRFHTKTLYEELVRVPLLVKGTGVVPRTIDEPVTLVDLGPTLLDLFGVETPGSSMGQSLVPLLQGRDVRLERPILAEGRLRKALWWGPLKVIEDDRRKVVEVFDLGEDPKELRNLFDDPAARDRVDPAVAALRAFFDVHTLREGGYTPVFKP